MNAITFEHQIDPDVADFEGLGNLLIPDVCALFQKPQDEGVFSKLPYSYSCFDAVMSLGNTTGTSHEPSCWYIATDLRQPQFDRKFDRMINVYSRYAEAGSGFDMTVTYHAADGEILQQGYGFDDASALGEVHIFPAEYWRRLSPEDGYSSWGHFLKTQLNIETNDPALALENLEVALALGARSDRDGLAVVRPPIDMDYWYSVRSFAFESP